MMRSLWSAASGMKGQQKQIDIVAHVDSRFLLLRLVLQGTIADSLFSVGVIPRAASMQ